MSADRASLAPVEFCLNGQAVAIDPRRSHETLLDFLRARGLTGAKEGCAEGECGACTVVLVSSDGNGRSEYRPVNSCLMFLSTVADQEVLTIEGLSASNAAAMPSSSDRALTEVQRAMASAGASQCGYCTPGFVMSLFAEQYRPGREGPCDPRALSGNLCRCTGYRPIRDAASAVGTPPPGILLDRLTRAAPTLSIVSTPHFSRPSTIDDVLSILVADPGATLVAGGSDLVVDANLRGHRPKHLVSLDAIPELRNCVESRHSVMIGAALPLTDIGRRWSSAPGAFHEWLELFASPPIRNRATLGGNLATASPIGDAAPLLEALDATVHVASADGRRTIPVSSFFVSYRRTAMRAGEIITGVEIPKPCPEQIRFYKVSKRRLDDISTVAAAMALDLDNTDRVARARFAFGGVAATPVRLPEAEHVVMHQPWNQSAVRRVQDTIERTLTPISDHRGSKEYRREVAMSLVEKFWWDCQR
jgi:xanthine dehydrogenase small subunit